MSETQRDRTPRPAPAAGSPGVGAAGSPLRVLQGTYEIAGQATALAQALRENGCEATSFTYRLEWDGRRPDVLVDLERHATLAGRGLGMLGAFARWAPRFDVVHLHFGTSFLPRRLDVPLLKAMGKLVVFHFHGCDVRDRDMMRARHRLATCTECDPFCRPAQQRAILADARRHADLVFFSTLDLAESVPMGRHLPLAVDLAPWRTAGEGARAAARGPRDGVNGPFVVAHAPTNRLIKGTRHVEAAVADLRAQFPRLELRLFERRPTAEMPALLADCDLLVDQLMMGWYGVLAIEGMAAGLPVVSHLREDFRDALPGLPVADAEPGTLAGVLRELIRDPARRAALAARGAEHAARHHGTREVGAVLLGHYREALARRGAAPGAGA